MSGNLPPGVTQRQIDEAFADDSCRCDEEYERRVRVLMRDGYSLGDSMESAEVESARGELLCDRCAYLARQER